MANVAQLLVEKNGFADRIQVSKFDLAEAWSCSTSSQEQQLTRELSHDRLSRGEWRRWSCRRRWTSS
jgi:hypothetical protein